MGFLTSLGEFFSSAGLLLIGGIVVVIVALMGVARVLKFINQVPPNKAYLVFGLGMKSTLSVLKKRVQPDQTEQTVPETVEVNYRIVRGGMVIVWPMVREVKVLDLGLMTLDDIKVDDVLSNDAVPITVDAVAQIKIGSEDTLIATAAEQLLDKTPEAIRELARQTLQGHLRAIIGQISASQVYKDRERFAQQIFEVAVDDLAGMGLQIVSFVPKELHDKVGYFQSLGEPEVARAKKEARIAKATADQQAAQREQDAAKLTAEYAKTTDIAKATYQAEVDTQRAQAKLAGPIAEAERDRALEQKRTEAAEIAAKRREQELEAEVRRPADAARYKIEQESQASLFKAEKEAEAVQITGTAQAEAEKAIGLAKAAIEKAGFLAEADGIEARLMAEAKGKKELADALNNYGPEALRLVLGQQLLGGIPSIAQAFATAFTNVKEIRLVDIGGNGTSDGSGPVQKFLDLIPTNMMKLLQGATALLGTPIDDIVATYIMKKAAEQGLTVTPETEKAIKEATAKKISEISGDEKP